jgi:hypothetical protein
VQRGYWVFEVHLALMTLVLTEYADEPIDTSRDLALVVLHDLMEIYARGTFLYDTGSAAEQKGAKEAEGGGQALRAAALSPERALQGPAGRGSKRVSPPRYVSARPWTGE